jgi:NADP-reducing hydrogenase subunit HndB
MAKIKSLEDLKKMKQDLQNKVDLRERADQAESLVQIKVGMATSGIASGAKEIYDFLVENLEKRGVEAVVTQAGDMGYSFAEPTIEVKKPGEESVVFGYVTKEKADEIIERYIKRGELVDGIIPQNYRTIDDE